MSTRTIGVDRSSKSLCQRRPRAGCAAAVSFSTTLRRGGCSRMLRSRLSRVWHARAARTAARCCGGGRRCPVSMPTAEYDLAGFIVGVVEGEQLIDGRSITVGDVLIGLPSSGLHTNGYSLARRIVFEVTSASRWTLACRSSTRRWAKRCSCRIARYLQAVLPLVARCDQGHGAHHRRRNHRQPAAHPAPGNVRAHQSRELGEVPGDVSMAAACRRGARRRHAAHVQHGHRPHPRVPPVTRRPRDRRPPRPRRGPP